LFGKVRLVDNTGNLERTFRIVASFRDGLGPQCDSA
jgi:hypothetical protein